MSNSQMIHLEITGFRPISPDENTDSTDAAFCDALKGRLRNGGIVTHAISSVRTDNGLVLTVDMKGTLVQGAVARCVRNFVNSSEASEYDVRLLHPDTDTDS